MGQICHFSTFKQTSCKTFGRFSPAKFIATLLKLGVKNVPVSHIFQTNQKIVPLKEKKMNVNVKS
jgi:hypothetical protein